MMPAFFEICFNVDLGRDPTIRASFLRVPRMRIVQQPVERQEE